MYFKRFLPLITLNFLVACANPPNLTGLPSITKANPNLLKGEALLMNQKIDDAIDVFKTYIEKMPDDMNGYFSLAKAYKSKNEKTLAESTYLIGVDLLLKYIQKPAVKNSKSVTEIFATIIGSAANELYDFGNKTKAIELLKQARIELSDSIEIRMSIIILSAKVKELEIFRREFAQYPKENLTQINRKFLAVACLNAGEYLKAIEFIEQFRQQDTTDFVANNLLIQAYLFANKYLDRAEKISLELQKTHPDNLDKINYAHANIYFKTFRYELAKDVLSKVNSSHLDTRQFFRSMESIIDQEKQNGINFVERLWRSVKYEDIYLNDYQSVPELRSGLNTYFEFYNRDRLHQSLDYRTPFQVHYADA